MTFTWTAGSGVSAYWLHLGTTGAGSEDLYSSGSLSGTSVTVTGIPVQGATVYATLYSLVNGVWTPNNYTYSELGLATLTSPTPGSAFSGSSVTFTWTVGTGVTAYWLHLGTTGAGSEDLYSSGSQTGTTVTVNNLPMKAVTVYATLYSNVQGVWTPVNYTYTEAPTLATLTSPAAGSTFPGSTVTFNWTAGAGVTAYWLHLGTTGAGSDDIYSSGSQTGTSVTVNNLPMKAATVYATLYSSVQGVWTPVNYTYVEAATLPALTSPAAGSFLPGSTVTFQWTAGAGITGYWLHLGTTGAGSQNLYSSGSVTTTSATVTGLPLTGATVYATLYASVNGGAWQTAQSITYTEPILATLTSPASGSVLSGSSATFSWSTGTGPVAYWLHLGTKGTGSDDIYSSGSMSGTSITVNGLPAYGMTLYATLYSEVDGAWIPVGYTMTESGAPVLATLTSPASGSTLPGSTVTFKWSAGHGPTAYWLKLGTVAGADNLYSSGQLTGTSIAVTGLPTSGVTMYTTLDSLVNGTWEPESSAVVEAPPAVSAVSCATGTYYAAGTDACTVTLDSAALAAAVTVTLSSNNSAVKVPASVTVAKGGISAGFNATVSAVTSAQSVTISAVAGATQTFAVQVNPPGVPTLSIGASTIAFGSVSLNSPDTQSLTLTSTGTTAVTISIASVSGTGFSLAPTTFPITLSPNQTATLDVEFDPTSTGSASGTLTITSNSSSGSSASVGLTGTGTAVYQINLGWDAPTDTTLPIAGYNVYRATGSSSTYQLLNVVLDTQTSYTDNSVSDGTTYDYYIESVDTSGVSSAPSATLSVTVP